MSSGFDIGSRVERFSARHGPMSHHETIVIARLQHNRRRLCNLTVRQATNVPIFV
jgi:hypothetical protein